MLSNRKGTQQNTKHRKTVKHISASSPKVTEWDVDAAVVGTGVVEGGVGSIPGEGLLVADGYVALVEPWVFWGD